MSNEPILLFLHGVGDGDPEDSWKAHCADALVRLGYPDLEGVQVIVPKYAHALKGFDGNEKLPGLTVKQPSRDAARKNRREFEHRTGAIEFRLGRHDHGNGILGVDVAISAAVGLPYFLQARNYLQNSQIRAQVLNRILATLPTSGNLVIVGHSLGSVIAADLIRRLPVNLKVAGLITIGSPLANGSFDVDNLRGSLVDPPTNLAWWVNFWNAPDPVAAHRGVSSVFPWIVDFRIHTKHIGVDAHSADVYLSTDAVSAAIGFALFGSRSKELAALNRGVDVPLDTAERMALLALRYAYLIRMSLDGDLHDRYTGALRKVQSDTVDVIRQRNEREKRPMPAEVARLAFDFSDPLAQVPEPLPTSHLGKEEAVVLLTVLSSGNVIRPFEITIPKDKRQRAMADLTAEMGLGSKFGEDVFEAAKTAQSALNGGRGMNWIKWGAIGVGAAAIVIATGGLALAAAPGVAGAAVITSALASFGPGGMIGGLLTAGTLVTAGGGGIAYGLASPSTSAATLEAVVERRLAAVILRNLHQLEQDPAIWRFLTDTEIEVRREYERLDEFSDESAPTIKELARKMDSIERALKYLSENKLEPGTVIPSSDESP